MLPLIKPYIAPPNEMMPALEKILYSGYIALGEAVNKFEEEFGSFIGNPNAIALSSGTASLHIALLLIGAGPGDEVISTAMTAEPTNTVIVNAGAKVVWADVDERTGLIDPEAVRVKITEHTKAIMLVHYAGMVCDMDAFNRLSAETGIPVIEDAAHALGARYQGRRVGSNSPFTCFSLQATKHLTTVDGGVLALKDSGLCDEARRLRWFGLDKNKTRLNNDISRAGFKYGMNNVNATIGSVQFRHGEEVVGRHIENGRFYDEALKNVSGVTLVPYYTNTEPSYWLYTLKVENRDGFIKMMESTGIAASPLHHRTDTHSAFAASKCELPHLDRFYKEFVHIPCGWWVGAEEREQVATTIRRGW